MDIKNELATFKEMLDVDIRAYLDQIIKEARKSDASMVPILQYIQTFVLSGGKRLRAMMMYHGYLMAGGKDIEQIRRACVGIELIHAFFLIHDDIMDRDEIRHGQDTVHHHFAKEGKKMFHKGDYEHLGCSVAIMAGDLTSALGSRAIFTTTFSGWSGNGAWALFSTPATTRN